MTPSNIVTSTLASTNNNSLAQTGSASILKLVGFEDALKKLSIKCDNPKELMKKAATNAATRDNALYALVTINGMGGGLLSSVASSNISATVLNGGTIALSGATQLHSFFKNHFSIQEQQEMFIKAIADKAAVIANCTAPATLTHITNSPKTILDALREYGLIEVELVNGKKFFLRNNGLCSIRLGIGSVVLLGISAGCAAAYGYLQYQAITSSQGVSDNMDVAVTTATPQAWGAFAV